MQTTNFNQLPDLAEITEAMAAAIGQQPSINEQQAQAVANRLQTVRGHEWVVQLCQQPQQKILLINGSWNLALALLVNLADQVVVWDSNPQRAAVLKQVWGDRVEVTHLVAGQPLPFAELSGPLTAVVWLDSLQALAETGSRAALIKDSVQQLESAAGQCLVLEAGPLASSGLPKIGGALADIDTHAQSVAVAAAWYKPLSISGYHYQSVRLSPDHLRANNIRLHTSKRSVGRFFGSMKQQLTEQLRCSRLSIWQRLDQPTLLDDVLAQVQAQVGSVKPLRIQHYLTRGNSTTTILLQGQQVDGEVMPLVVRLPLDKVAACRQQAAANTLNSIRMDDEWLQSVTPQPLPFEALECWRLPVFVETQAAGTPAETLLRGSHRAAVQTATMTALLRFNTSTAETVTLEQPELDDLLGGLFRPIVQNMAFMAPDILEILHWLEEQLLHRRLPLCHLHGDMNSTNVLCDPGTGEVSGIIDWDMSEPRRLPLQDAVHFFVSQHRYEKDLMVGEALIMALEGQLLDQAELQNLQDYCQSMSLLSSDIPLSLIIDWAHHVSQRLQFRGNSVSLRWQDANVIQPTERILWLIRSQSQKRTATFFPHLTTLQSAGAY